MLRKFQTCRKNIKIIPVSNVFSVPHAKKERVCAEYKSLNLFVDGWHSPVTDSRNRYFDPTSRV